MISEGVVVYLDDRNNDIYYYNINTFQSHLLYNYNNNILFLDPHNLYFSEGKLLVTLSGADQKLYFTSLDINGNQLFEPIKCDEILYYSNDRLITIQDNNYVIYNTDGKIIFNESRSNVSKYTDGFAVVDYRNYIDKNGELLFEDGFIYE